MDRLLNSKQAADFLNVPEITVRRRTNQRALSCYRGVSRFRMVRTSLI